MYGVHLRHTGLGCSWYSSGEQVLFKKLLDWLKLPETSTPAAVADKDPNKTDIQPTPTPPQASEAHVSIPSVPGTLEHGSGQRPAQPQLLSKLDLLDLVDHQDAGTVEEHLRLVRDPYLRGYAAADGPNIVVSDKKEDIEHPAVDHILEPDSEVEATLSHLRNAVMLRLKKPYKAELRWIYRIYRRLPEPRMSYVPSRLRHLLLRVLAQPRHKDFRAMLRYLAVVTDVKNSGIRLTRAEWNSAISFASKCVAAAGDEEVESALNLWREMEQSGGIRGNEVTFNVLFSVASKAGKFMLAERIYKEMENRGYTFTRYHYVSLIHFFGLKRDADGVRAAYRDMVNSKEIIDTVVLNCVISGLLRSGEADAAERVYERMKGTVQGSAQPPPRDYQHQKVLTKLLMVSARTAEVRPDMEATFQARARLAPDLRTYRLLIHHYAVEVGDLSKVVQYLDDMKRFHVPMSGAIFLMLFKGFYLHGGHERSAWSAERLDGILKALFDALDRGTHGVRIETWLVMWVLRALKKCSPSRERLLQAYEELQGRSKLDERRARFMAEFLEKFLKTIPHEKRGKARR
ncbi:hypothetical protein VTK73DRAFT_8508 [Phialemonium thermophilum]|uniref:Pentatricopeptide repeat protein n=1 Tax=Phialemonium thermophilum TaxID=223376 RepID=A0ABR3XNN3_9PEZI